MQMRAAAAIDQLPSSRAGSIIADNSLRFAFSAVTLQDVADQASGTHFKTEIIIQEPINQGGHIGSFVFHFIIPLIL